MASEQQMHAAVDGGHRAPSYDKLDSHGSAEDQAGSALGQLMASARNQRAQHRALKKNSDDLAFCHSAKCVRVSGNFVKFSSTAVSVQQKA